MAKKIEKIKVFLASSITELSEERRELENHLFQLNARFEEKYGIGIKPIRCENYNPHYKQGGNQEDLNEIIEDCDVVFFLFYKHLGDRTEEELKIARKHCDDDGTPLIFTFFKEVPGNTSDVRLAQLKGRMEKERQDYFVFDSIAAAKLKISEILDDYILSLKNGRPKERAKKSRTASASAKNAGVKPDGKFTSTEIILLALFFFVLAFLAVYAFVLVPGKTNNGSSAQNGKSRPETNWRIGQTVDYVCQGEDGGLVTCKALLENYARSSADEEAIEEGKLNGWDLEGYDLCTILIGFTEDDGVIKSINWLIKDYYNAIKSSDDSNGFDGTKWSLRNVEISGEEKTIYCSTKLTRKENEELHAVTRLYIPHGYDGIVFGLIDKDHETKESAGRPTSSYYHCLRLTVDPEPAQGAASNWQTGQTIDYLAKGENDQALVCKALLESCVRVPVDEEALAEGRLNGWDLEGYDLCTISIVFTEEGEEKIKSWMPKIYDYYNAIKSSENLTGADGTNWNRRTLEISGEEKFVFNMSKFLRREDKTIYTVARLYIPHGYDGIIYGILDNDYKIKEEEGRPSTSYYHFFRLV